MPVAEQAPADALPVPALQRERFTSRLVSFAIEAVIELMLIPFCIHFDAEPCFLETTSADNRHAVGFHKDTLTADTYCAEVFPRQQQSCAAVAMQFDEGRGVGVIAYHFLRQLIEAQLEAVGRHGS